MRDHDHYRELAEDQRCADFATVRNWVFDQIDHNLPQFAHDIACMLAGPEKYATVADYHAASLASLDELRRRLSDAVADQPETEALACRLEDADREEEDDYFVPESPYDDACHRRAVAAARRAEVRAYEAGA